MDPPKHTTGRQNLRQNHAINGTMQIRDLKPFADQLMLIAQHLREGEFQTVPAPDDAEAAAGSDKVSPSLRRLEYAEMARRTYLVRRKRAAIFGNSELFGEPAWDILLDLYVALAHQKPVSVSSACIGSAAPPTTGLRWLGILAEEGLVVREPDPEDQRRVLVRLTEKGACAMDRFFEAAAAL